MFEMIDLWWGSLTTALQVFYGIALSASLLLVLQLVLALFGFDSDVDVDLDDGGTHVLSVRTVVAFFTGFGWGGVIALKAGWPLTAAVAAAAATGGALMAMVYFLMRGIYAMRYSGTLDYRNAIGVVGNVYLPVPANMEGPGQVEVLVQGRLAVVQAFTRSPDRLANRSRVRVVDTLDQQTLLVEPLEPPAPAAGSTKGS